MPANLASRGYVRVTSDVFNICERIKEISPNLRLNYTEGRDEPWVVTELSKDGEERFVSRHAEADARILERLQYMLHVPIMERLRRNDAVEDRNKDKWDPNAEAALEEAADQAFHLARKAGLVEAGPSYRKVKRV